MLLGLLENQFYLKECQRMEVTLEGINQTGFTREAHQHESVEDSSHHLHGLVVDYDILQ